MIKGPDRGRGMLKRKMVRCAVAILSLALIVLNLQKASCNFSNGGPGPSPIPSEQQEKDKVADLPGLSFNLNVAHYAGFVTVDHEPGRALFYWFFEAVEDPSSKPLVLWLNGGPGCSSIGFGVAEEIGPFHIKPDGKTLYPNPYSWNQVANMLFLDSPVGSGYSYSNNSKDGLDNGDERTAKEALVFLEKWFERFPQYKGREFYIVGESYAGHFVPQLAQAIVRSHKPASEDSINLKGYMVGNALTDDFHGHLGVFQYMWTAGMISDETYRLLNIFCVFQSFEHIAPECQKIIDIATEEHGDIDEFSVFAPTCTGTGKLSSRLLKRKHSAGRINEEYDACVEKYTTVYFNSLEVQKALHVDPAVAPSKWEVCSDIIEDHWKDSAISVLDIYRELIHSGLRIWMFSGNADAVMPVPSTRYSIEALNLTALSPWHAWYHKGQVGGWTQDYDGLTYVTVRGAGHQVPRDKPEMALIIIKAFLSGSPMPTLSKFADF